MLNYFGEDIGEFYNQAENKIAAMGETLLAVYDRKGVDGLLDNCTVSDIVLLSEIVEAVAYDSSGSEELISYALSEFNLFEMPTSPFKGIVNTIIVGGSGSGSGVAYFSLLIDGPGVLKANKWIRVNGTGKALEYVDAPVVRDEFEDDFTVSLADNKPYLKWKNGAKVPAKGKTAKEVMLEGSREAINPSVELFSSAGQQPFNEVNVSTMLTWNIVIHSLGATLANFRLERSRDEDTWSTLSDTAAPPVNYHDAGLNPTIDNRPVYYQLTVTDTAGGKTVADVVIPFAVYVAPVFSTWNIQNSQDREKGNTGNSGVVGASKRSPNIPLISGQIQYRINNDAWINLGSSVSLEFTGAIPFIFGLNNPAVKNADTISFRAIVTDGMGTTTSPEIVTSYRHPRYLAYSNLPALTMAQILAMPKLDLSDEKEVPAPGIVATTGATDYTYWIYAAADGDLNNIIMNGAAPVLGAFAKLGDVTGVNSFGATLALRVYRSNAVNAFTNDTLVIS